MKASLLLVVTALLSASLSALAGQPDQSPAKTRPWAKFCHAHGIETRSAEDKRLVANLVKSCEALDACLLSCMRSGYAKQIGGGCFHACGGPSGELNLMQAAAKYESGTAYLCRRPPNNSFKPKPLRGSA